jgi:hypothetical protein
MRLSIIRHCVALPWDARRYWAAEKRVIVLTGATALRAFQAETGVQLTDGI